MKGQKENMKLFNRHITPERVDMVKDIVSTGLVNSAINPMTKIVGESISDIVTSIGMFAIRNIKGKFQRNITFTCGATYRDSWMEDALYTILYKYNDIKKSPALDLGKNNRLTVATLDDIYYRLPKGMVHYLKYRHYNITLLVSEYSVNTTSGRPSAAVRRAYTVSTFNLDPDFVTHFEQDMINNRNALLRLRPDSKTIDIYQYDGDWDWDFKFKIHKRRLSTIYLPTTQKKLIVDTVNTFFASKEYYIKHGIPYNLKVLLHGGAGVGKDSVAKAIASEWSRNIYYIDGGDKDDGAKIPHALMLSDYDLISPLFLISDIDKYQYLINDTDVDLSNTKDSDKENKLKYKLQFGKMINALDGVLSGEGRIIVMTTNHIEKFSPVFLRPGRIDLNMKIDYVTPEVFRKYVYDFYGEVLPETIKLKDNNLTIATMQFDVMFMKLNKNEFVNKYCK